MHPVAEAVSRHLFSLGLLKCGMMCKANKNICIVWFAVWLVCCLVVWFVCLLVGMVGWLVCWLVGLLNSYFAVFCMLVAGWFAV